MVEIIIAVVVVALVIWKVTSKTKKTIDTSTEQPGPKDRTPPWDEPPSGPTRG